jgi:hypothetical protein
MMTATEAKLWAVAFPPVPACLGGKPVKFSDYTISIAGNRVSSRVYDTSALVPGAVEVFHTLLDQHGPASQCDLPLDGTNLSVRWTIQGTAAAITFYPRTDYQTPLVTSILATCDDVDATEALRGLQNLCVGLTRKITGGAVEPGFDLLRILNRPALFSVPIPHPDPLHCTRERGLAADAGTCFAAALLLEIDDAN